MADRTLELQKAVIDALRADAAVGALVGDRIYDQAPQTQFEDHVSLGPSFGEPWDAQGMRGWRAVLTLDAWTRGVGRVACRRLMAAITAALHREPLILDAGTFVSGRLTDQRTVDEDMGQTVHGVMRFEFLTVD